MGMENYLNILICGNLILIVNSKESDWLGGLIQTTDTLFPSGGYAHSYGLEEMVALGKVQSKGDLEEFLIRQISIFVSCKKNRFYLVSKKIRFFFDKHFAKSFVTWRLQ